MKVVLDANIVIAALIKDGATRRLLLTRSDKLDLCAPALIIEEIIENIDYISKKAAIPKEKVLELAVELFGVAKIGLIENKSIVAYRDEALRISPDKTDALYFAVALHEKCGIWSNEKKLKLQNFIKVITTKEIIELL